MLGFGRGKLATFTYSDQGAETPHDRTIPANMSGIVKWAMTDRVQYINNAPSINIGQLEFALNARLVRTAQGQGKYSRE